MSNKRYLTKTRFKLATECPSKLYYYGKTDEYANQHLEDEFLLALAEGGFQIGELAKYYYPGGIDIESFDYDSALKETNAAFKNSNVIIYEAAVRYENCFIRADIFKKEEDLIHLIEVKSKSIDPVNDSFLKKRGGIYADWKPYLYDIAFQAWVTAKAFPDYEIVPYLLLADKSSLSTVNGLNQLFRVRKDKIGRVKVELTKPIDPWELGERILIEKNVSSYLQEIWNEFESDFVKSWEAPIPGNYESIIKSLSDYCKRDEKYPVRIGGMCKKCEFNLDGGDNESGLKSGFHECWKTTLGSSFDRNKPLIFDIWNFRKSQEYIDNGKYYMEDLDLEGIVTGKSPDGSLKFKNPTAGRQYLQFKKTCQDKDDTEEIAPELFKEIIKWEFPLNFIDFETSRVAIPFNAGRRPYEQIAFQFSCHTLYEDGRIEHLEWIMREPGVFPNFIFARELKNVLDLNNGTIFRYHDHEKKVLKEIKTQLENFNSIKDQYGQYYTWIPEDNEKQELIDWIDRLTCDERSENRFIEDMYQCVVKYYYHPRMKGSNSIKSVLPAIFSTSEAIKRKYRNPLKFGTNLLDFVFWQYEADVKNVKNPYYVLPPLFNEISMDNDELFLESGEITDGGAAMMAYGKLQFTEMSNEEREAIIRGLLRYCELDTLAMLMIYEHWRSLDKNLV